MKKIHSGKVRDIYDVSDSSLVIVTTDRISAFDVVLPKPVPGKGKILNAVSKFWFDYTRDIVDNHILSDDLSDMPEFFRKPEFEGRAVLVKKIKMMSFEFIVRGYMFGSMWNAYSKGEEFCGKKITGEYKLAQKLEKPLFTPSTKAEVGHDEYIATSDIRNALGSELFDKVEKICSDLYKKCYDYAYERGIIIADTKFEFGMDENGGIVLADELFTPDSSRFWNLAEYKTGVSPNSYDKQLLRDWLSENKVNGEMQFDKVPDEVLKKTSEIYEECLRKLTNV